MPKYLIKLWYTVENKKDTKIIDVQAGSIGKAKQMAANVLFNEYDHKQRQSFKITKADHVRFRDTRRVLTSNQRKRQERAERLDNR